MGRIAVTVGALPQILPVTYACHGDRIIMCAARGSTLERATRDAVVAFEVDHVDHERSVGWSVIITGVARRADAGEARFASQHAELSRWAGAAEGCVVSLSWDVMSGRRFRP